MGFEDKGLLKNKMLINAIIQKKLDRELLLFTKESLYINAVKHDNQLKVDYKKFNNGKLQIQNDSLLVENNANLVGYLHIN